LKSEVQGLAYLKTDHTRVGSLQNNLLTIKKIKQTILNNWAVSSDKRAAHSGFFPAYVFQ